MPYIEPDKRPRYIVLDQMPDILNKGDLEYCVFKLQKIFMRSREKRYTNYHDAVYGSMHCADEYRRRYLDIREDEAKAKNGDVEILDKHSVAK